MSTCQACGGLIMTLGVAYGYAGPVCRCIGPIKLTDKPSSLDELIKRQAQMPTQIVPNEPFAVIPPVKPPAMTADQFVIWLRGYFASTNAECLTKGDFKVIIAKLDALGGPK